MNFNPVNFSLREIEYFVAVAKTRHFGKAAQHVNVSQPTLSMQLKKLEDRLGGKLIERLPGDALLTPLGTEILPLARELLRLASGIETRCSDKNKLYHTRIGMIPTVSPYLLPKINRSLSKKIKEQKISFIEAQTADLIRLLKEGTIDIAVLGTPIDEKSLEQVAIYSEPFHMAVCSSHPLARQKNISPEDLKNEKLLLLGEGHCLRNQALSLCKFSQADDGADLSSTSLETLRSMVALGNGITLMPQLAIRKGDNVTYIPFSKSSTSRTIGLVYRSSYNEIKLVNTLVEIIRNAALKESLDVRSNISKSQ